MSNLLQATRFAKKGGQHIYAFRRNRTNQVLYSFERELKPIHLAQLPDIGANFNPQSVRKDEWSPLWTVTLPDTKDGPELGRKLYQQLYEYRKLHELCWERPAELDRNHTKEEMEQIQRDIDDNGGSKRTTVFKVISRKKKMLRARTVMNQRANSVADLAAALLTFQSKSSLPHPSAQDRQLKELQKLYGNAMDEEWRRLLTKKIQKSAEELESLKAKHAAQETELTREADADFAQQTEGKSRRQKVRVAKVIERRGKNLIDPRKQQELKQLSERVKVAEAHHQALNLKLARVDWVAHQVHVAQINTRLQEFDHEIWKAEGASHVKRFPALATSSRALQTFVNSEITSGTVQSAKAPSKVAQYVSQMYDRVLNERWRELQIVRGTRNTLIQADAYTQALHDERAQAAIAAAKAAAPAPAPVDAELAARGEMSTATEGEANLPTENKETSSAAAKESPATEVTPAPATQVKAVPATETETAPTTDAKVVPATETEATQKSDTEAAPATETEAAPSESVDVRPKDDRLAVDLHASELKDDLDRLRLMNARAQDVLAPIHAQAELITKLLQETIEVKSIPKEDFAAWMTNVLGKIEAAKKATFEEEAKVAQEDILAKQQQIETVSQKRGYEGDKAIEKIRQRIEEKSQKYFAAEAWETYMAFFWAAREKLVNEVAVQVSEAWQTAKQDREVQARPIAPGLHLNILRDKLASQLITTRLAEDQAYQALAADVLAFSEELGQRRSDFYSEALPLHLEREQWVVQRLSKSDPARIEYERLADKYFSAVEQLAERMQNIEDRKQRKPSTRRIAIYLKSRQARDFNAALRLKWAIRKLHTDLEPIRAPFLSITPQHPLYPTLSHQRSTSGMRQVVELQVAARKREPFDFSQLPAFPKELVTEPFQYSAAGTTIQWADTLDAEYAEAWPAGITHQPMGVTRFKPPTPPRSAPDEFGVRRHGHPIIEAPAMTIRAFRKQNLVNVKPTSLTRYDATASRLRRGKAVKPITAEPDPDRPIGGRERQMAFEREHGIVTLKSPRGEELAKARERILQIVLHQADRKVKSQILPKRAVGTAKRKIRMRVGRASSAWANLVSEQKERERKALAE